MYFRLFKVLSKLLLEVSNSNDSEQENKIQRLKSFFWSRIDGTEPPVPQSYASRISLTGQFVKSYRKKIKHPVKPRSTVKKQLRPGIFIFQANDADKLKIDVIEIDALTASYSSYHKEALDFQICREFLPSHCFKIPYDMKIDQSDKVWFMYEGTKYNPITNFFNENSRLAEQNPLFTHWRCRIATALCDIAMYGSKSLVSPLHAKNIQIAADGDTIAIVDAHWGPDKELESRTEPLAVPSLVNILEEIVPENMRSPVLSAILEVAKDGACTIYDIVMHPFFRSGQSSNDVKGHMKTVRAVSTPIETAQPDESD